MCCLGTMATFLQSLSNRFPKIKPCYLKQTGLISFYKCWNGEDVHSALCDTNALLKHWKRCVTQFVESTCALNDSLQNDMFNFIENAFSVLGYKIDDHNFDVCKKLWDSYELCEFAEHKFEKLLKVCHFYQTKIQNLQNISNTKKHKKKNIEILC